MGVFQLPQHISMVVRTETIAPSVDGPQGKPGERRQPHGYEMQHPSTSPDPPEHIEKNKASVEQEQHPILQDQQHISQRFNRAHIQRRDGRLFVLLRTFATATDTMIYFPARIKSRRRPRSCIDKLPDPSIVIHP